MAGLTPLLVLLLWPAAASAHSELTGVEVRQASAGSNSTKQGIVLVLTFSEAIDPGFGRATLVDVNGKALPTGKVQVTKDLRHMQVDVPSAPPGTYTLGWFVRSRDGDASNGSTEVILGTGAGTAAVLPAVNARDPAWQPPMTWRMTTVSAFLRWFNYLGAALVAGALLFQVFIWPVVPRGRRGTGEANGDDTGAVAAQNLSPGFAGIMVAGIGILFLANMLLLLLQASFLQLATIQPVDKASPVPLDLSGLPQSRGSTAVGQIFGTFAGQVWLARLGLILLLGVLTWRIAKSRGGSRALILGALTSSLALLLTISLSGHAAFVPETFRAAAGAVAIDWTHLVAMSLWLGGLLPLFLALGALRRESAGDSLLPDSEGSVRLLRRFSPLALASVAYLALSGIGSSYFEVGNPRLLVVTVYGVTLDVKLLLVGILIALGALSRYVLIPRAGRGRGTAGFRRTLPLELTFGGLLLFSVGMLASQGAATTSWPAHEALGIAESQNQGPTEFLLRVAPGQSGKNAVAVDVTDLRVGAWHAEGTMAVVVGSGSDATEYKTERLTFANTTTERFLVPQQVPFAPPGAPVSIRLDRQGYAPMTATFQVHLRGK